MIDAYLTGKLSPEDSDRFLQSLDQDPTLKEEFLLQKDMVHSLQSFRKQQLKARLNNIEVGSGYSFTSASGFKFMVGTALLALLGTGAYFVYNQLNVPANERDMQPIELAQGSNVVLEDLSLPQKPSAILAPKEETFAPAEHSGQPEPAEKATETTQPAPKNTVSTAEATQSEHTSKEQARAGNPEIVKPEVITSFDEQDALRNTPKVEAPADNLAHIRSFDTKNIEVSTKEDKRYPFHYSFYENQLRIYGDFSQVPYEVLEVNSGISTNYYLYHDGKYYELNPKQKDISRLKELKNQKIIDELEVTRAEKLTH